MNFKEFEYIIAIYEEKSISKAAKRLYISQPSLSQFLQKVENQLDDKIFLRTKNGLILTDVGQTYIKYAKQILKLNQSLNLAVNDIKNLDSGSITLGVPVYRGSYILPIILPAFKKQYPNIYVNIIEENSLRLEQMLLESKIELAILCLPFISEELSYDVLLKEKVLVAFSSEHPLSKRVNHSKNNFITINEIKNEEFIFLRKGQRIRYFVDKLFEEVKITPKVILETKSIDTAKRLSALGYGITFIPDTYAHYFKTDINPLYIPLDCGNKLRKVVVAHHKNYYQSKAVLAFRKVIINEIQKKLSL